MNSDINIYCDESCHLEHDHIKVMVLGALSCPKNETKQVFKRIREIKVSHGLDPHFEIKWNKVSESKFNFYRELIDFYFDLPFLGFRAIVIPDKSILNHKYFNQTHDQFYYKMYFDLLKVILDPLNCYNIFLDVKDTRGGVKIKKLHEVLCSNLRDHERIVVKNIEQVSSTQVELIQLCDLLVGAFSYYNRGLGENSGKNRLIKKIQERSSYTLDNTTLLREFKLNILIWKPDE